ncbi:flagellar basal body rod protein FlgB [Hydrogenimonas sp.]
MQISRVHGLMAKALDYRAIRQDMISANIANVDTPFYRSRDIAFEGALATEKAKLFPRPTGKLELARTDAGHLAGAGEEAPKPEIFFRDGHLARNDGNTVDLDVETTEMAKNTVMYNALVAALKKDGAIFRSVLDASAKT